MLALSVKQPWATWILEWRDVETRSWPTKHRGPLLICSSKTIDQAAVDAHPELLLKYNYPVGAALGTVDVVGCRLMRREDEQQALFEYDPTRWVWMLRGRRKLERTFPVKGMLGLFEVALP